MADENALSFEDLFDPSNRKPIEDFKNSLIDLAKTYKKQIDSVIDSNELLLKSQEDLKDQAKLIKDQIKKVNPTLDSGIEKIVELAQGTDQLSDRNKHLTDQYSENTKQLSVLKGKLSQTNNVIGRLTKTSTQLEKIQGKISEATTKESLEVEKARQQLNQLNKERREAAKEAVGLINSYQKASRNLNELRNTYKSNSVAIKENGTFLQKHIPILSKVGRAQRKLKKEVLDLDKELKELDESVGQSQRNVGAYEKAAGKAKAGFNGLIATLTGAFFAGIVKTRKQAREFQIFLEQAANTAKVLFVALSDAVVDIVIPKFKQLVNSVKVLSAETKMFFIDLVPDALKDDEDFEAIITLKNQISELNAENRALAKSVDKVANPFDNLGEKLSNTNSRVREQLELEDDLINKTAILSKQINDLQEQEELLAITADDNTEGFARRIQATLSLQRANEKRIGLQVELARQEADAAVLAIKNDLEREGSLAKVSEAQIRNLQFLKDRELADSISIENLNKLQGAVIQLADAENELTISRRQNQKTLTELFRDNFEIELDFAVDAFDNIKTINEQKIGEETRSLKERFEILQRTTQLSDEAFEDQIALIDDFRARKLSVEAGITEDEAKQKLKRIDLNELVLEEDQRIIRERLRAADIDEITLTRILEVIRERRTAVNDLRVAEEELNRELKETSDNLRRDLELLRDSFAGEEIQIDTTQLSRLIELQKQLSSTIDLDERKAILDQLSTIEKDAAEERREIIFLELEGRKSIIQNEIDLRKEANDLTIEEERELQRQIAEIDQSILQNQLEINRKELEEEQKQNDEMIALRKKRNEELKAAGVELARASADIVNAGFEREIAIANARLEEQQRIGELNLILAGENQEKRAEIALENFKREEELRRRSIEAQRKQAAFNKAISVTEIAINTAVAIARTLAEVPKFDFGISTGILVATYAALGAAQIAAVLAQPLPQFKEGTMNAPKGWAITDEVGSEIHTDRRGKIKDLGSSSGPRIKHLEKGDRIYTAEQSKPIYEMLKDSENVHAMRLGMNGMKNAESTMSNIIFHGQKSITKQEVSEVMEKTIAKIPINNFTFDERGYQASIRRGNQVRNYIKGSQIGS